MCNHVLEHVVDDDRALSECSRILMPGGVALFTIPGDYTHPHTRQLDLDAPDLNGHYRHYGMDVIDKMGRYFDDVEAVDMSVLARPEWRVRRRDYVFICRKTGAF